MPLSTQTHLPCDLTGLNGQPPPCSRPISEEQGLGRSLLGLVLSIEVVETAG